MIIYHSNDDFLLLNALLEMTASADYHLSAPREYEMEKKERIYKFWFRRLLGKWLT